MADVSFRNRELLTETICNKRKIETVNANTNSSKQMSWRRTNYMQQLWTKTSRCGSIHKKWFERLSGRASIVQSVELSVSGAGTKICLSRGPHVIIRVTDGSLTKLVEKRLRAEDCQQQKNIGRWTKINEADNLEVCAWWRGSTRFLLLLHTAVKHCFQRMTLCPTLRWGR